MVMPGISLVAALNSCTNLPMFTPCWPRAGPTGGLGVAWPPGHCSFTSAVLTRAFAICPSRFVRSPGAGIPVRGVRSRAYQSHLPVFDVDRRRPAENLDHDADGSLVRMDFVHVPFEVVE